MDINYKDALSVRYKIGVIEYASVVGVTDACREFEVSRSTFYVWKNKYDLHGKAGLYRKKPIAKSHPRKTSPEIIEKILELRKEYKLGSLTMKLTTSVDRYAILISQRCKYENSCGS